MTTTIDADKLAGLGRALLTQAGLSDADAATVADSLVAADLRGVASHGIMRLPIYLERMGRGLIQVRPEIQVERTGPATARLDGGAGPGQVVALAAMREAIELAREAGAGFVSVRNSSHFGAAAWYADIAAREGMIGLAFTHSEADVVPFGGARPALGTNPLAVGIPRGEGRAPLVLDMATSEVAMGKVLLAAAQGREIPSGWAVDAEGRDTTDPTRARAVRPMSGPKGYGLALVVEVLAGVLAGARTGDQLKRMYDDFDGPQGVGHLLGAIDVGRFIEPGLFAAGLEDLLGRLVAVPPADGFDEVLLPGDVELRAEERHRAEGVPLAPDTERKLRELGEAAGVAWPD
jgi:ureidoglycolate dehydrogenase (NAD+)